jgi:hypothetical protein
MSAFKLEVAFLFADLSMLFAVPLESGLTVISIIKRGRKDLSVFEFTLSRRNAHTTLRNFEYNDTWIAKVRYDERLTGCCTKECPIFPYHGV